ncbi:MAG: type transport system ATP-binding protein [Actinomycetota bacterium]|nr:type transport system ATP-binding protein [Actinomycetota bacterium]
MDASDEPRAVTPRVVVDRVTHRYRGGTVALDDVKAQWPHGTIALLGPNGAGKSTLLRILVGDLTATSGRIAFPTGVGGHDDEGGRSGLGYLPQKASWPGHFSVEEFAFYFCWVHGVPKRQRASRTAEVIEAVDLGRHAKVKLAALSGGQHRRAMLTQALVGDPAVLVLDEPTAGFDPGQRILFRELVGRLGTDRTIILSTHLIEDVESLATWVTVLDQGTVAFDGAITEFAPLGEGTRSGSSLLEKAYLNVLGVRS